MSSRSIAVLILFVGLNAYADSFVCEHRDNIVFDEISLEVERHRNWYPHGQLANLFPPEVLGNFKLQAVMAILGTSIEHRDKSDELPLFTTTLVIRESDKGPFVSFSTSSQAPDVWLYFYYGENCGQTAVFKYTHNK